MTEFILSQFLFYFSLLFILFIPGFFLILATRMYKEFSILELFVLGFSSSVAITDFLVIALGKTPFHITKLSVIAAILLFCVGCYLAHRIYLKKNKITDTIISQIPSADLPKRSTFLVVLILFLTIFIKTIYFQDAIFPTATDLGHHMYWTKTITVTGQLPRYEKSDVGPDYTIGKPTPIADFIIGEHLIFAAIALVSGAEFVSAFPVLVLFLVHIMTILTIFILVRALFKKSSNSNVISIIALLLVGPLYAIASPQAKFISGGVIGNDIGNLLIPILVMLFMKAFAEKKSAILAYALFLSLGLSYTHHLSTFVFIFLSIFTFLAYAALNHRTLLTDLKDWMKLFLTREVLFVIAMGAIFIFALYTPTYLNTKAIDTAVGAPSKATRTGLTMSQLQSTAGEARFAFAALGILLLVFAKSLGKYNQAFLIGWLGALTLMSLRPDWLLVDIPSNRIASYVVYPTAIIGAFMFASIFSALKSKNLGKTFIAPATLATSFFVLATFIATNGLFDNAVSLNTSKSSSEALQTFAASKYLAGDLDSKDMVLKDHNYLSADSWIKIFFMKGYNYPLSRGYFKRYEDETKSREQCTNFMITSPASEEAQKCFIGTGTDFIMISPKDDSAQFHRLDQFWQIYSSDAVGIFYKAK